MMKTISLNGDVRVENNMYKTQNRKTLLLFSLNTIWSLSVLTIYLWVYVCDQRSRHLHRAKINPDLFTRANFWLVWRNWVAKSPIDAVCHLLMLINGAWHIIEFFRLIFLVLVINNEPWDPMKSSMLLIYNISIIKKFWLRQLHVIIYYYCEKSYSYKWKAKIS